MVSGLLRLENLGKQRKIAVFDRYKCNFFALVDIYR
jgi:hypothetical protein